MHLGKLIDKDYFLSYAFPGYFVLQAVYFQKTRTNETCANFETRRDQKIDK